MKNVFLLIGRCYYQLGRNLEAIEDAEAAIQQNCESVAAREALAQALYSDGQFEKALIQFYRVMRSQQQRSAMASTQQIQRMCEGRPAVDVIVPHGRLRRASGSDWVIRCEDTINSYLAQAHIEPKLLEKLVESRREEMPEIKMESTTIPNNGKKQQVKTSKKKKILGKLSDDLVFLDKLIKHPALQSNILNESYRKQRGEVIRVAAMDGLSFLEVRKHFWESSECNLSNENQKM